MQGFKKFNFAMRLTPLAQKTLGCTDNANRADSCLIIGRSLAEMITFI